MKKIRSFIICAAAAVLLCGCGGGNAPDGGTSDSSVAGEGGQRSLVTYNDGAAILRDFKDDEKQKILEAFDVKIPENETGAYINAFIRESEPFGSEGINEVYFWLEIGGVEDYNEFYKANDHRLETIEVERKNEDGTSYTEEVTLKSGFSLNQLFGSSDPELLSADYFLTYNFISFDNEKKAGENFETYKKLENVFAELQR